MRGASPLALLPGVFFRRHDMTAQLRTWRTPSRGKSREPARPSGTTKPSAWRAFLRPAGHRTYWGAICVGRAPSQTSDMPDREPGKTVPELRHGIRLDCRSIPKPEHHGPRVRPDSLPLPPANNRHETTTPPDKPRTPSPGIHIRHNGTRPRTAFRQPERAP